MATVQEAVRRLTVESRSVGVKETAKDARELGAAVDGVAVASQRAEKATQSMEGRLASIQRKYDAQFRAQMEMAKLERTLAAAQAQGLITMQRRLELQSMAAERHGLATAAVNRETAAVNALAAANRNLAAANNNRFNTANIAAQFQDIGVTAAMGMSPIQIALQQGTQLSAVFDQIRSSGQNLGTTLAAAFTSLVSPVSLLTIGTIALGTAAVQYFMGSAENTRTLNDVLADHEANIARIKDRWGEAAKGLEAYRRETEQIDRLRHAATANELRMGVAGGINTVLDQVVDTSEYDQRTGVIRHYLRQEYEAFAEAIEKLRESTRGPSDLLEFRSAVADIWSLNPNSSDVLQYAQSLLTMSDDAARAALALPAAETAIDEVGRAAARNAGALADFGQALNALGRMIPDVAQAMQSQERLTSAYAEFSRGQTALTRDMEAGAISVDQYARSTAELAERFSRAKGEVTGYATATRQMEQAERQAAIAGMTTRDAAAARIRDQYAEREEAVRRLISSGTEQSQVEDLLRRNTVAMNQELAASARHFDEMAAKAGAKGAAKELRDLNREIEGFRRIADGLAASMFPANAAAAEAAELLALVDRFGDKLSDIQRQAVDARIDLMFDSAAAGVRDLSAEAGKAEKAWQNVGNVIAGMFDKPLQAGETFFDRMLSQAGQLGQALQKAIGGTAGGIAGSALGGLGAGYSSQNPLMGGLSGAVSGFLATGNPIGAIVGGIAGLIGGIFGAAKKAREEAAKTAKAMDDLNLRMLAVSTATDTLDGALTVFDAQARVEVARLREARAAADLILKTEQALALDRLAISRDFAARERDAARDALQQAYDREVGALRDLASAHRNFADGLIQFQNALRLDTGLTSLNPRERLDEAERQYRELDALAAGGDQQAMGRLTDAARNWLDEAMSYYAATTDYFAVFNEVNARIGDLAAGSLQQATVADRQLAALERQYAPLLGIQQGVQSLAAATAAYHAADYSWQNAQYAVQQQQVAAINALAANRSASQAMPSLLERMMDTSSSQSLWDRIFNWAPGFASGGDFTVRGSGGTDSVPVMFRATPGERVSIRTPSQAANGTNDTGELRNIARVSADGTQAIVEALVREVGALRAEIAEARRETREAAEDRRLSKWRDVA